MRARDIATIVAREAGLHDAAVVDPLHLALGDLLYGIASEIDLGLERIAARLNSFEREVATARRYLADGTAGHGLGHAVLAVDLDHQRWIDHERLFDSALASLRLPPLRVLRCIDAAHADRGGLADGDITLARAMIVEDDARRAARSAPTRRRGRR